MSDRDENSFVDHGITSGFKGHIRHIETSFKKKDPRKNWTFWVHDQEFEFDQFSLGCFTNTSKFRYTVAWIITWKAFEKFIMALILLNAVLMGMKDYLDKENTTPINKFIKFTDPFFNFFVYFEFVLKAIGMGLSFEERGFFGDSWNWLDFFVVLVTAANDILPLIMGDQGGGGGMKTLRSVRLMRPLKLLRGIPSIRILISTLLSSVGSLGGIMGVAMFVFLIFAILGVTLWDGKIHQRCYIGDGPPEGLDWVLNPDVTSLCSSSYSPCPEGSFCGSRYE